MPFGGGFGDTSFVDRWSSPCLLTFRAETSFVFWQLSGAPAGCGRSSKALRLVRQFRRCSVTLTRRWRRDRFLVSPQREPGCKNREPHASWSYPVARLASRHAWARGGSQRVIGDCTHLVSARLHAGQESHPCPWHGVEFIASTERSHHPPATAALRVYVTRVMPDRSSRDSIRSTHHTLPGVLCGLIQVNVK